MVGLLDLARRARTGLASLGGFAPIGGFGNPPRCSLPLLAVLLAAGCGSAPLCARSTECEEGTVCGLRGHCERLRDPEDARFAASRWLSPLDWGVTASRGPLIDAMPVGGRHEALLAFGPLPEASRLVRALLVLHPHDRQWRIPARVRVVVELVGEFRGGPLPPRHSAGPTSFAAAVRDVAAGPARPVRFDVTQAARGAARERLHLLIRTEGSTDGLWFSSPTASDPAARPRVELIVR